MLIGKRGLIKLIIPFAAFILFGTVGMFMLADNTEYADACADPVHEYFGASAAPSRTPLPQCGSVAEGNRSCLEAAIVQAGDIEIVRFVDFIGKDGSVLSTEMFACGEEASYEAPEKDGYTFIGWELPDGRTALTFAASEDKSVTAIYSANN